MANSEQNSEIPNNMTDTNPEGSSVMDNEYRLCCNIDAHDLDQETVEKLKGDRIGDTLYSQSFVLKILLQFSDLNWNDQVEGDLCFLWDMTVEKDVCKYLLDISYPSIAVSAVIDYNRNNRFVEIVIGILANIFCSGSNNRMSKEEIAIILGVIRSDDPLVLIQVMRFISTSVENSELISVIHEKEDIFTHLCYILQISVNTDLLLKTVEAIAKLTSNCKIKESFVDCMVYDCVINGYKTLIKKLDGDQFDLDTKEKVSSVKYMLEVIVNLCVYIERFKKYQLLTQIQGKSDRIIRQMMKILSFFCLEENLLPITDNLIFIMSSITYTYTTLELRYMSTIFLSTVKILDQIIDIKEEVKDIFESTLELVCYLIFSTEQKKIQRDLKQLSRKIAKNVLNVVNDNYHKYGLSSDTNDSLTNFKLTL